MDIKMNPLDIQAAIKKTGINQRKLASKLGVSESLISMVIKGTAKSQRVQDYIATRLDMTVSDVWPDKPFTTGDSATV
jgi:lambda repressor-like predicted transcriptional regulator